MRMVTIRIKKQMDKGLNSATFGVECPRLEAPAPLIIIKRAKRGYFHVAVSYPSPSMGGRALSGLLHPPPVHYCTFRYCVLPCYSRTEKMQPGLTAGW